MKAPATRNVPIAVASTAHWGPPSAWAISPESDAATTAERIEIIPGRVWTPCPSCPIPGHTDKQHDRQDQDRDKDEGVTEMVCLRDQRERDHRARQHREEHAHAAKGFAVCQGTRRQQAPVLGGEHMQQARVVKRRRLFLLARRPSADHRCREDSAAATELGRRFWRRWKSRLDGRTVTPKRT